MRAATSDDALKLLEEAVDLYSGDFLQDIEGEWCIPHREQLQRAYLDALTNLGQQRFRRGQYAEAADAYRRAVTHDNLLEVAYRELMRCYARQGERGQALRHYQTLVTQLSDELGAQPAPETTALFERIRRGEDV